MTQEQDYAAQFKELGFFVIKNALSESDVDILRQEALSLEKSNDFSNPFFYYEDSLLNPSQKILRRVERIADYPEVGRILRSEQIQQILFKISGECYLLFKDKLNFKLPGSFGFKPHIDGHFYWIDQNYRKKKGWAEYGNNFINVVIPLDPFALESGPLKIASVKDTYKAYAKDWDHIVNYLDPVNGYVREEDLSNFSLQTQEISAGDIAFFSWLNIHGSESNTSQLPRKMIFATYSPSRFNDNRDKYYYDKAHSLRSNSDKVLLN